MNRIWLRSLIIMGWGSFYPLSGRRQRPGRRRLLDVGRGQMPNDTGSDGAARR